MNDHFWPTAAVAQSVRTFDPQAEDWVFESQHNRPKSLDQVVTAAKRSAIYMWVSRVPGDGINLLDQTPVAQKVSALAPQAEDWLSESQQRQT